MKKNIKEITSILNKLNEKEYLVFREALLEIGWTNEEIKEADDWFAVKGHLLSTNENKKVTVIQKIYEEEIDKICHILNSDSLLKKINGLRIMFHGKTGTGKTSLVKKISELNSNIEIEYMDIEDLISPKLGQTQINLMVLANDINNKYKDEKRILFFDEIDSIVNNRTEKNDVAEHSRIVSTFIKFLDKINENIIVFAATNMIEKIDSAISRRFNINVKGKMFNIQDLANYYNLENENNPISIRLLNSVVGENEELFNLSDLNSFTEFLSIEESLKEAVNPLAAFIVFFEERINLDSENFSRRIAASVKKVKR